MQETLSYRVPLFIMTMFFSVLALNIAVPAVALAAMGLSRWVLLRAGEGPALKGRTA